MKSSDTRESYCECPGVRIRDVAGATGAGSRESAERMLVQNERRQRRTGAGGMAEAGERRYLDDFQVGQRFTSETYTMTEAEIVAFAREFDPQPFHLSHDAARDSFLGGLVASGWHTAAVTMRLQVACDMLAGGMVGTGGEITWPAPTRPGDVLSVESEVLEVRPSRSRPDIGLVTTLWETKNQDGIVVQMFKGTIVVPRR
jgi:acyl dehydratase